MLLLLLLLLLLTLQSEVCQIFSRQQQQVGPIMIPVPPPRCCLPTAVATQSKNLWQQQE